MDNETLHTCPKCGLGTSNTLFINLEQAQDISFLEQDEENDFDPVHKPSHYQGKYGLEALEVMENFVGDLQGMSVFYFCNALKYLLRFQYKNGMQDLEKCIEYCQKLIEEQKRENSE